MGAATVRGRRVDADIGRMPRGPVIDAMGITEQMRGALLDGLSDGVYFVDLQRRILYWNRGAEELTGYPSDEVLGHRCKDRILTHCDEAGRELCGSRCPLLDTMRDGEVREAHVFLHHRDGHRRAVCVRAAAVRDGTGAIIGAVETFHDDGAYLDSQRRAAELRRSACTDALTGVGNRLYGEMVLENWIEQRRRFERPFGLLFVDVDHLKALNDDHGHACGDAALRALAQTARGASRGEDEVIRWGGDEFLVVVADAGPSSLARVAARIVALARRTRVELDGASGVRLSVSIGATLARAQDTPDAIVRRADALLYDSKGGGRNRVTLEPGLARGVAALG